MADQTQTQKPAPDATTTTVQQPQTTGNIAPATQQAAAQQTAAQQVIQQPAAPAPTLLDFNALVKRVETLEASLQAAHNTGVGNTSMIGTLKSSLESIGEVQVQQTEEVKELKKQADIHDLAIEHVQTRRIPKPLEDPDLKEFLLRYGVG